MVRHLFSLTRWFVARSRTAMVLSLVLILVLVIVGYTVASNHTSRIDRRFKNEEQGSQLSLLSNSLMPGELALYYLADGQDQSLLHANLLLTSQQASSVESSDLGSSNYDVPYENIAYVSPSPNRRYLALTDSSHEAGYVSTLLDLHTDSREPFPTLGPFEQVTWFFDWFQDETRTLVRGRDDHKLWILNMQTGDKHSISFDGNVIDAVVSPNGTEILVNVYFGSGLGGELWLVSLYENNRTLLLKDTSKTIAAPVWSADASYIAFIKQDDLLPRNGSLWVIRADGTDHELVGPVATGFRFRANWHPHLPKLSYVVRDNEVKTFDDVSKLERFEGSIVTVDVVTDERQTLSPGTRNIDPAWSPDGRFLAFVSNSSGADEVWIADDSGNVIQATSDSSAKRFLFWQQ